MKKGMLKKMVATICVAAATTSCVGPHVGAIKILGSASSLACKKIGELNNNIAEYSAQLNKIRESIKQLNLKIKGQNKRVELYLNTALRDIDSSIDSIKTLDDVLLGNEIFNIDDMQDDLSNLSSEFRVLGYLVSHCQWNEKDNDIKYINSNEMELEENDELLPGEIDKISKDVEERSVRNVLLQYTFKVKDSFNSLKNKITRAADNIDNSTNNQKEIAKANDKISGNKSLFDELDKIYSDKNEKLEEKTRKTIEAIKKFFPKAEDARLRAMVAFDVINKYKEQGIKREEIIKELVEPVVRDEMELSFKRFRENVSSVIVKKLDMEIDKDKLIKESIKLAVASDAKSLYDFCFVAFYGNDTRKGFYDVLDNFKVYWYNKYTISKDNMVLPVMLDIVELNSFVLRLEELEHIGLNADNIRKASKIFDKIFCDKLDEDGDISRMGMYNYLSGERYEDDLDNEQKYVGQHPLLHELNCHVVELMNGLLVDSEKETNSNLKEKAYGSIEKIKNKVKEIDDKYSNFGKDFDIPGFASESNEALYNMRLDFYEKMTEYDKWKKDNELDNLYDLNNFQITFMTKFRKNKHKAQHNNLTSEEFIKSFEEMQSCFNEQIEKVKRWQSYHKYRSELHRFLDFLETTENYYRVRFDWHEMFCDDSILTSIMTDAREHYNRVSQDPSDQNMETMEEISRRSIKDIDNVRKNLFILEHEKRVNSFMNRFDFDADGHETYRDVNAENLWKTAKEFREYYEEHRYNLNEEKIEYLKELAEKFNNGIWFWFEF